MWVVYAGRKCSSGSIESPWYNGIKKLFTNNITNTNTDAMVNSFGYFFT